GGGEALAGTSSGATYAVLPSRLQETRLIRKGRVVPVMVCAGFGLAFLTVYRLAWAQHVPVESHPAGAFAVIAVVSLVGLLIAVIAVGDLRERRAAEAMRLQSSGTGALRRQAAPIELHLTLNVHVPVWRGSPARIEVAGHVAAPEQSDVAPGIARAEVAGRRRDLRVADRTST